MRRALSLLLAVLSACKVAVPAPDVPGAAELTNAAALETWGRVLERRVDADGRIDFEGLGAEPAELERFVAWVAAVGPETHPERFAGAEARVAYYLDAYNALAMYNVLHAGVLPSSKVRFFYLRQLDIDGRRI